MRVKALAAGQLLVDLEEGPGPSVVGLHGWGRDRRDLAPALDRGTRALVDLPGFGASPPPPAVWGGAEYAALVAAALAELDLPRPLVVVGHSFGGRVAVCLAATRPDLVDGVVLCGVPLLRLAPASRPSLGYRLVRLAHRAHLVSDAAMERRRQRSGSADYRNAQGIMRDVLVRAVNETYEDELARAGCPVSFLWGEGDTAAPAEVARRASAMVPRVVEVEVVAGAGHDVHRQHPERVRAHVDAVVDQVSR
jgi:pimeloyl-ACP methyl ester carboxylesterase